MDITLEFMRTDFNYDDKEIIQAVTSGQHKQTRTRISTFQKYLRNQVLFLFDTLLMNS